MALVCTCLVEVASADETLLQYAMQVPRTEEADTFRFAAFQVERYDSNFFRLPDGVSPSGDGRRSTTTSTTGLGIGFDKFYGLQHVVIDAAVTRDLYAPYGNLDFTGYKLSSRYDWAVTPDVTGSVIFQHARLPTDYEFTQFRMSTNPRTTQTARFDVDWRAGAAIHPQLSFYTTEDTTQDPTFQIDSYRSRNARAALVYQFRSTNTVQAYVRGARGNNSNQDEDPSRLINNDFTEGEAGILAQWNYFGLTSGEAAIGRLQRNYSTYSQRSFDGLVAHVNANYVLTGKTTVRLSGSRTLNGSQTDFSSYYIEDLARLYADYAATGKIVIRPIFQFRRQVYRGAPFSVATPLRLTTRDSTLQVEYAALRALDFALELTRSSRDTSDSTQQFVNRSASVSIRVKF